jgi:ABC-type uncharacterized transport system permease subunit
MIGFISAILCSITFGAIWYHMQARASGNESARIKFIAPWTLTVVAIAIMAWSRIFSDAGLNFYFYNSLFIAAFAICSILFLVSLFKQVEHLGLIVLPVTLACIVLNILFLEEGTQVTLSPGIQTHIITSIIAFSILGLAAVQAILLFFQDRTLRSHKNTGILRALPSLHENETLLFQTITLGVAILTIALVSGFIYIEDIFAQHLAHKTLLSSLAWIVFAILLWGRMQFGWRGTTAIRWSLSGFTFLILAYFGSKFVLELVL